MLDLLVVITVALVPVGAVGGLLLVAERIRRARERVIARQVAITDALHHELGAVVAPTVAKRPWGSWRVVIPVAADQPALAGQVLTVAHRALAGSPTRVSIVLLPRH